MKKFQIFHVGGGKTMLLALACLLLWRPSMAQTRECFPVENCSLSLEIVRDDPPSKDDNPMNGISTFDLVLMSKHILDIDPLPSPYKIIAADINKSNSVTTFDILELRKLILGIYSDFPDNTSWRFIKSDFTFTNPANPFASTPFEESAMVTPLTSSTNDFIGIKIGDLNGSVIANRPTERPITTLSWPSLRAKPGEIITLPVRYAGAGPPEAIQLVLRFDPAALTLLSPSAGDLPGYGADNFGLTRVADGEIRSVWLVNSADLDRQILPGDVLFYLHFRVNSPQSASVSPLQIDDAVLANAAWRPDGEEYALTFETVAASRAPGGSKNGLSGECRPNPTSGSVVCTVRAERAIKRAHIAVYGPFGNRLFARDVSLTVGEQSFDLPEIAALPAGVYVWKVYGEGSKAQGHLIKQ